MDEEAGEADALKVGCSALLSAGDGRHGTSPGEACPETGPLNEGPAVVPQGDGQPGHASWDQNYNFNPSLEAQSQ